MRVAVCVPGPCAVPAERSSMRHAVTEERRPHTTTTQPKHNHDTSKCVHYTPDATRGLHVVWKWCVLVGGYAQCRLSVLSSDVAPGLYKAPLLSPRPRPPSYELGKSGVAQ